MENTHTGHRDRLKNRFLEQGLDGFEPHQVLELLLFYAIPQQDVNPLAHLLLERFGSLGGVLDAPVEELMQVPGIKKNAATLLKLLPSVARLYIRDKTPAETCYDTLEKVGRFAVGLFVGVQVEQVYLMMFNNRMELLKYDRIAEGSVNHAPILPREIARQALRLDASGIVLLHNHPDGTILPSAQDVAMTHQLEAACNLLGIRLIEHLVVAGEEYMPILRSEKGTMRPSPMQAIDGGSFYRRYYGETDDNTR